MPRIRPFRALRPPKELAKRLSCLPYDVMNTDEARIMAAGNDASFLHIVRSEIDLAESTDPHSPIVYEKAKENFDNFREQGLLVQDKTDCFYIYEEIMNDRSQRGVVALASCDDYEAGKIKRHEYTLPEKELDRINNFLYCRAHTEPVFFVSKTSESLAAAINKVCEGEPEYDFVSDDNITHRLWVVSDTATIAEIAAAYEAMEALYIADGHHRTASSVRVRNRLAEMGSASSEADYIMAVIFPEEQVAIMDYNRLLVDLAPYDESSFLEALAADFTLQAQDGIFKARETHVFSLYIGGRFYKLTAKPESFPKDDPVESLDAAILQSNVFYKLLGIDDPRTSRRLKFVGGIRGYDELVRRVDSGEATAAFGLCPVDIAQLLAVADAGAVMPPKSTWFEPKLRSGLFVHLL